MSTSPIAQSLYLTPGQADAEQRQNDFNNALEQVAALRFITFGSNTPPGSPSDGDCHWTGSSPTGDWAGEADKIAYYYGGWVFISATAGMFALMDDASNGGGLQGLICYTTAFSGTWFPVGSRYNTTEYFTGRYDTDGSGIFAKTISLGGMPNNTTKNVAHGASIDFTKPVAIKDAGAYGAGVWTPLPQDTSSGQIAITVTATNVVLASTFDASGFSGSLTLEYRKT